MKIRHLLKSIECPVCHRFLRCECGWVSATVLIVGAVVAAAGAGYGAYSASEAQAQQNAALKKNYQLQEEQAKAVADNEKKQGEARARAIEYDANRREKSFLSSAAASGVDIGSGSLLEGVTQFGSDKGYAKSIARYTGDLASQSTAYKADLYGFAGKSVNQNINPGMSGAMAGGSTLATSIGSNAKTFGSLFNSQAA